MFFNGESILVIAKKGKKANLNAVDRIVIAKEATKLFNKLTGTSLFQFRVTYNHCYNSNDSFTKVLDLEKGELRDYNNEKVDIWKGFIPCEVKLA